MLLDADTSTLKGLVMNMRDFINTLLSETCICEFFFETMLTPLIIESPITNIIKSIIIGEQ